jgi:hypothetical protein
MARDGVQGHEPGESALACSGWRKLVPVGAILCAAGTLLSIHIVGVLRRPRADALFRQYILDTIPSSVADIKVDQPKAHGGYGYVFRFALGREDLDRIRSTRPFREAEDISYVRGTGLSWNWTDWDAAKSAGERGASFLIYPRGRQPSWYDLPAWNDPRVYVLRQEQGEDKDIQVLLYNMELGQAYFIAFHYNAGLM